MPQATERWSERRYSPRASAQRGWDVSEVADEVEAIAAVNAAFADAATEDAPFVLEPLLRGVKPTATRTGPVTYRVTQQYNFPATGSNGTSSQDPLDQPTEFEWDEGLSTEPMEYDAEDPTQPVVNTAYVPFAQQPSNESTFLYLAVYRTESSYDVAKNVQYRNKVNSDEIQIPNVNGKLFPGQMMLTSYRPTARIRAGSSHVPVMYRFAIAGGTTQDADGLWDAFKTRIRSEGLQGWYLDGSTKKPGPFCNEKGVVLSQPVLLNNSGYPFNAEVKVLKEFGNSGTAQTAVAAPTALSSNLLETAANVCYLKFRKRKKIAFAGLGLF